jgi:hypothetical protein
MEIVKQNETFILTDTTEVYETSGTISKEASGAFNVHFNVKNKEGERVGDCHYNKYGEGDSVNFGVSSSEEVREALTTYANELVESAIEYFKPTI